MEHTGAKRDKSEEEMGLGDEACAEEQSFDYTGWTLVMFDLNGTLLYRKWISPSEGHGPCTMRTYFKEFLQGISKETKTLVGVWTGATSVKKMNELLGCIYDAGINKKTFFCCLGALAGCKTRRKFPGTTKPIVLKPVSVLKCQILPPSLKRVL